MVRIKLFQNNSDERYMKKKLDAVNPVTPEGETPPEFLECNIIEPMSIESPRIIFSTATNVLQANYLYIQDLGRYYYIRNHICEHNRIIVECEVDVLMSFNLEIMEEDIIIDRTSNETKQNFYINDDEIVELAYPWMEVHKLKNISGDPFDQSKCYYILGIAGAVAGSSDNEGGE